MQGTNSTGSLVRALWHGPSFRTKKQWFDLALPWWHSATLLSDSGCASSVCDNIDLSLPRSLSFGMTESRVFWDISNQSTRKEYQRLGGSLTTLDRYCNLQDTLRQEWDLSIYCVPGRRSPTTLRYDIFINVGRKIYPKITSFGKKVTLFQVLPFSRTLNFTPNFTLNSP